MNDEPGGSESAFLAKAQNASTMAQYFGDFKLLLQRSRDFGKPVVIHLEPDGFAFLEQQTGGNTSTYAAVAASGVPELAGLPDTVAGWGLAFLQLRKATGANNVIFAVHVSSWADGVDISTGSTGTSLQPDVDTVYAFLAPLGLGANFTGSTFDLLAGDPLDRDADYYRLTQNTNRWWDASDTASVNSQSFNRYASWLRLWNQKAARRWMLWQIATGNSASLNTYNNGSAGQGYRDNRAEYFFANGTAHAAKFVDAGVIMMLFGAGATGQSTHTTDMYSDGKLFLQSRVGQFYAGGGVTLAGSTQPPPASAPSFTASATAAPSTANPGSSVSVATTVTDTGAALSSGIVDVELHDAAGAKIAQQFYTDQSFSAGQTRTFNTTWTAPIAAGAYSIQVGVFGASWTPTYLWNASAGTLQVGSSDSAVYSFETGTQGWAGSGAMLSAAWSSSVAFAGTHSLAVNFGGTGSGTGQVFIGSPSAAAGKVVTFHLWIPAGSAISSVQPYVQQGSAGGWQWTGNWQSGSSLKTNAWNTIAVQVPPNAATTLYQMGVQFSRSATWSGTAYLDTVSW